MSGILQALLIILTTSSTKGRYYQPCFGDKEMASEKLDKMPKVTQAVNGGAEYLKQDFLSPKSDPLDIFPVGHCFRTCSWTKFHFREAMKNDF